MNSSFTEHVAASGYGVFPLVGEEIWALRSSLGDQVGLLERYNPDPYVASVTAVVKAFHQMPEWKRLLEKQAPLLSSVVGKDIRYQREPYVRVLRRDRPEDSVGIHRDTHYGALPSEWVMWVPLTDGTDGAELTILPGSHLEPEEAYPWRQEAGPCERGSDQHWLGFMYAPKKMAADVEERCVPVQCMVGQAMLFNTNCVHGIKVNTALWTRWSFDIRLVDASAKVIPHGIHGDFYASL